MDISSMTRQNAATASMSTEERTEVEKEGFLKLLIAQLSNQDPMNPQDSDKYVQQFSQFSQLEQLMNLNKSVDNLSVGQLSNNNQEALRFVGRDVIAKGTSLHWDENGISPVRYHLPDDAESVTMNIYDANGEVVRTVPLQTEAGKRVYQWDGTDENGKLLEEGEYSISIEALGPDETPIPVDTYVRGRCEAVRFDNGYPELIVDGKRLRMSDITEVGG